MMSEYPIIEVEKQFLAKILHFDTSDDIQRTEAINDVFPDKKLDNSHQKDTASRGATLQEIPLPLTEAKDKLIAGIGPLTLLNCAMGV